MGDGPKSKVRSVVFLAWPTLCFFVFLDLLDFCFWGLLDLLLGPGMGAGPVLWVTGVPGEQILTPFRVFLQGPGMRAGAVLRVTGVPGE